MSDIVIFGVQDFASLAHFYFRHDSDHRVIGFTVDEEYMPTDGIFEGLPVFPFENIETRLDPTQVLGFAPLSSKKMNKGREDVYRRFKEKGFSLATYISSRATRFCNVGVGDNCFILEDNTIQPYSTIGSNVVLWSGNHIGHHSVIEDNVFVSSHVVICGHCRIGRNCFLGVNASVRDGVTLGEGTFVAMDASITKNTEPWSVFSAEAAKASRVSSHNLG